MAKRKILGFILIFILIIFVLKIYIGRGVGNGLRSAPDPMFDIEYASQNLNLKEGKNVLYFENQLKAEVIINNGKLHGVQKIYYVSCSSDNLSNDYLLICFSKDSRKKWKSNEQMRITALQSFYEQGQKIFEQKYSEQGQLLDEEHFKHGKLDGVCRYYAKTNGKLRLQIIYQNGKRNGLMQEYFGDSGELFTETFYKNDKKHGV